MDITYEDGTTVTYDDGGDIVQIVDAEGALQPAPGPAGSAVVQQFSDLFNFGARAWIDSTLRGRQSPSSPQATAAPGTASANARGAWRQYLPLALLGVGAFVLLRARRA